MSGAGRRPPVSLSPPAHFLIELRAVVPCFLRAKFLQVVFGFTLLVGGARSARAEEGSAQTATTPGAPAVKASAPAMTGGAQSSRVFLVTVGPGSDLYSLWGHAALCVSEGELILGRCLDFGLATTTDSAKLALGTLWGEALFRVVNWPAENFLAAHRWRDVWVQQLRLSPDVHERVVQAVHDALTPPTTYSYEPVLDNCSTRLRDLLDTATSGALGRDFRKVNGPGRRTFAEHALAGRVLPLTLLALSGNTFLDSPTSDYERMAFPDELRLGVERHLGVAPIRLHTRFDKPLSASPHGGKIVLLALGTLASVVLFATRRKHPLFRRLLLAPIGLVLGLFAAVPLFGAATALPSLSGPLAWLLWPTDVALGAFPKHWLGLYALLRIGVLTVGALWLVILGSTALVPAVVAVILPLAVLAWIHGPDGGLLQRERGH